MWRLLSPTFAAERPGATAECVYRRISDLTKSSLRALNGQLFSLLPFIS
jgi:hypothetical protein